MGWTRLKPNYAGALKDAIERYRTPACRMLANGFLSMLDEAGGVIPQKNDLNLQNFVAVIPHLALVAVTKPDKCIYRVAGERLKERVGLNLAGRNYYDFVPPERRDVAARAMHMVIDTPCAVRAEIQQSYSGGSALMIEATGFPLKSSEPGIDGFILFADQAIEPDQLYHEVHPQLRGANVVHRDLIDLGFGVDADFEDIVQTE
ncbi:PAS domain-containing protein [Dongia sp.]|uniref:PAS domain-containing protein n=1 Tax=Dongia sp. TaxID=1977262 RepID=UPI0035B1F867